MKKLQWPYRRTKALVAFVLTALLPLGAVFAQPDNAVQETTLEAVDIGNLPGNRVQLRFQFSQPVTAEPRSFTINEPPRIVLDFPNTHNGLSTRQQLIGKGVAERISVLEDSGRTRASVHLVRLVPYAVRTEGKTVLLTLEAGGALSPVTPNTTTSTFAKRAPTTQAARTLTDIDFRRGPQGEAIISITLSDPTITVDVREEGKQIIADFRGATLPRDQERRLDVSDFATPVALVDALNRGNNARIVVQPTGRYEYMAYQTHNLYTIEVRPIQEDRAGSADPTRKQFTGDLLSLNFQDIEVRAVLQIIADFTGLNVVVSDTVQGNLTLRLQNVPWDQALDIILRTKGLTQRQNGNVIYIAPTEEVTAREKLELDAHKQIVELTPVRSELIQVNYAKAATLGALLKSNEVSLLSARGQVTVDERTNTLLVQDVADKLAEIRSLVTRLDVPVRQVMIDSRVVIANDDFSRELGVRFGATGVRRGDTTIGLTGSATGTDTLITTLPATGSPFPTALPPLSDRLGVNLGTLANPFGRLALAILGRDYLLDLELSALQAEGRGEILSNPRVITTDRKQASIKQGFEVPYVVPGTVSTPPTVQFKEALLKLEVIPQITPDNRVIMDLTVTKDEPDFTRAILGNPPLNKREVITQVLVNNGETVVLGGVFEQVTNHQLDKVPFLGNLPAVGRLFQRTANQNRKLELLIFVTPQIITDALTGR